MILELNTSTLRDMILYPKFSLTNYTVTYLLQGGINHLDNPLSFNLDSGLITLKEPERYGFNFLGWKDESGQILTEIGTNTLRDISLTALWEAISYSITYNLNGATIVGTEINSFTILNLPFELPTAKKDGYEFVGWYDNPELTGNVIIELTSSSLKDLTLTPKFEPIDYVIKYYSDGQLIYTENPITYNVSMGSVTLKNPNKVGYQFLGWYLNPEFTGSPQHYILPQVEYLNNLTFYAKWEIIVYHITYNLNGGDFTTTVYLTYTINDETIVLPQAKKTGYTFLGWYDNPEFTGNRIYNISGTSIENYVLYAKWG